MTLASTICEVDIFLAYFQIVQCNLQIGWLSNELVGGRLDGRYTRTYCTSSDMWYFNKVENQSVVSET